RRVGRAPLGFLHARPPPGLAALRALRRPDDARPGAVPRLRGRVPAGGAAGVRAAVAGGRRPQLPRLRARLRGADADLRRRLRDPRRSDPDPAERLAAPARPRDRARGARTARARAGAPLPLRPLAGIAE